MEVGFFDSVQDIKQKLQSRKGWSANAPSLFHNGNVLADVDGSGGGTERYGIVEGSVIHVALVRGRQQRSKNKKPSKRRDGGVAPLRVNVVSRCGGGRARRGVGAVGATRAGARGVRDHSGFPLPRDGAYFSIHRQSVMDEARSFEWHGVEAGDEVVVFEGSLTRGPAY